ncbi:MAG: hypothetical protein AAF764_10115 [Pseudomonadota bacterium]
MRLAPAALMVGAVALTACQTRSDTSTRLGTPQSVMVNVAQQMQACWFKPKLAQFRPYRLAAELDSYSGKPRVLLVPRNQPAGLPKLVAQAERRNSRTQFTSFGPLLKSNNGPALRASMDAWAKGSKTC